MIKSNSFLLILLLSCISSKSEENNEFVLSKEIDFEKYKKVCKENIYIDHELCFRLSQKYEKIISNALSSINITTINETNKEIISFIYYSLGNIYYHGFISKEPDLDTGLAYFIISSYFGSPHSKYKLSIILSNDIFEQIYKEKKIPKFVE
jgi:hypothetical protein